MSQDRMNLVIKIGSVILAPLLVGTSLSTIDQLLMNCSMFTLALNIYLLRQANSYVYKTCGTYSKATQACYRSNTVYWYMPYTMGQTQQLNLQWLLQRYKVIQDVLSSCLFDISLWVILEKFNKLGHDGKERSFHLYHRCSNVFAR